MLRGLLEEALELASSAFDEVRPKPPDDGLVRQRRHDRARHVAREAVAEAPASEPVSVRPTTAGRTAGSPRQPDSARTPGAPKFPIKVATNLLLSNL